jgi:hypothetical protein
MIRTCNTRDIKRTLLDETDLSEEEVARVVELIPTNTMEREPLPLPEEMKEQFEVLGFHLQEAPFVDDLGQATYYYFVKSDICVTFVIDDVAKEAAVDSVTLTTGNEPFGSLIRMTTLEELTSEGIPLSQRMKSNIRGTRDYAKNILEKAERIETECKKGEDTCEHVM